MAGGRDSKFKDWLLAAGYLPLVRSFKPRKARKARKLLDEEFRVFSVFRG